MTYGILESINERDRLQNKLLKANPRAPGYDEMEENLKKFNAILQTCRRKAKKVFYKKDFEKRKDSIRETWKGINNLITINFARNDLKFHV